jgi:hypothetical protein
MIKATTKRRIEKLEQVRMRACNGLAEQAQQLAFEALDLGSLEQLVRFMERQGQASNATEEEKRALLRYFEKYQAEAVRITGRTWSALVRARMV